MNNGSVIWEKHLLPDSSAAHLTVPVHLGTDVGFSDESQGHSVVVLSDGRRVSRLDWATGDQLWSLEAPGVG